MESIKMDQKTKRSFKYQWPFIFLMIIATILTVGIITWSFYGAVMIFCGLVLLAIFPTMWFYRLIDPILGRCPKCGREIKKENVKVKREWYDIVTVECRCEFILIKGAHLPGDD